MGLSGAGVFLLPRPEDPVTWRAEDAVLVGLQLGVLEERRLLVFLHADVVLQALAAYARGAPWQP
jgi:hypothetical protein